MKAFVICVLLVLFQFAEGVFRCDYKFKEAGLGWFKHYAIPATWEDARLRCMFEHATLASPTSPQMIAEITKIMKREFPANAEIFTGIHATFSPGVYNSIEGVPLDEMPVTWAENEPDNQDNEEHCLTMNCNGELADTSCEKTRPYICYRPDQAVNVNVVCSTVDPDYFLDPRTGKCYKFHRVPRTFEKANLACSAEGGHLVIINSELEAQVIKELFRNNPASKMLGRFWKDVAFIGMTNWGQEQGDWRTIHGQTLEEAGYDKFSPGEPNNSTTGEYCGAVYRTGLLNDLWCNTHYAFICEKKPDHPSFCEPKEEPLPPLPAPSAGKNRTKGSNCKSCKKKDKVSKL